MGPSKMVPSISASFIKQLFCLVAAHFICSIKSISAISAKQSHRLALVSTGSSLSYGHLAFKISNVYVSFIKQLLCLEQFTLFALYDQLVLKIRVVPTTNSYYGSRQCLQVAISSSGSFINQCFHLYQPGA